MTTRVKLSQRDHASASSADHLMDKISESKFRRNPIVLYVLASVLVHAIGLVLFTLIEPLEPRVQMVPKKAPIDFVVVPPEESSSKTPTDPLPQEQTQTNKEIEPEPPTPEKIAPPSQALAVPESIPESAPTETPPPKESPAEAPPQPEPPSQTVAVPEPIPESAPTETPPPKELPAEVPLQPEPVTPPSPSNILAENQNSSEILSGSDPVVEETEIKTPEINKLAKPPIDDNESEDRSVATRLPPKIKPTRPLATEPPVSPPSSPNNIPATSRASLLGGNLKRSYEDDGGDSFFNLENNASQQAYNPKLDAQQSIDMRKYFSEIQRRVKRNWNPKYALEEYTTVLTFSIQRNGQITLLAVRRTSGSQEVDREALEAVQDSAPFDPLPANFPLDEINVEFNFNIYIY